MDMARDISGLAALLADPTRARVCVSLMDGCAWTAGELAHAIEVSPQAMSACLSRMEEAGVIMRLRQGRHAYVKLRDRRVAQIVEFMGTVTPQDDAVVVGYRQVRADRRLRAGRTCYNHVAGRLGVGIAQSMERIGLVDVEDGSMRMTDSGVRWFSDRGIDVKARKNTPRIRGCLDWTERRMHIAGTAGTQLYASLLGRGLLRRAEPRRALRVTPPGIRWFAQELHMNVAELMDDDPSSS